MNLNAINGGVTENIAYNHIFTDPGEHEIKIEVDPDGIVTESIETNQIISKTITVLQPTAELSASAINVSNANPETGDLINYSVTLSNNGSNDASNFDVTFSLDGVQLGSSISISSLVAGDSQIINSEQWIVDDSPHVVAVNVDIFDVVPEINEFNNTIQKDIGIDLSANTNHYYNGNSIYNRLQVQMGIPVELYSRVYNNGTFGAANSPVSYWIDDELLGLDIVPLVNSRMFSQSSVITQFNTAGNYAVRIYADKQADGTGIFNEIDESNNFVDLYVHVYEESCDLEILSHHIAPEELNPDTEEEITISFTIVNKSNIDSGQFLARILVDGTILEDNILVNSIPAYGETTIMSTQLFSSAEIGVHIIRIDVNYTSVVVEYDITNNTATRAVIVGDAPDFLFSENGIILSDDEPEEGDQITISTYLLNYGGADASAMVKFWKVVNTDSTMIYSANFSVTSQDSAFVSFQWYTSSPFGTIYAEVVNSNPAEFNTLNNSAIKGFGNTIQQIDIIADVDVDEDETDFVAADLDEIFENVDDTSLSYYFETSNDSILDSLNGDNHLILNFSTNWNGAGESFTVTAENIYGDTLSIQIQVTVNPQNDAPEIALPTSFTMDEDSSQTFDFSIYISDAEQILGELTLSFSGNVEVIVDQTDFEMTFSAPADWFGMETVEFSVNDNQGRSISTDSALIVFNLVNDVPVISFPVELSFEEDLSETYDLSEFVSDVDNPLSELTLNSAGSTHISVDISGMEVTFSSNTEHWNGDEEVLITVSDNVTRTSSNKQVSPENSKNRSNISDVIMIHCTPVDDFTELYLPESLIFGPGESRELDLDDFMNEYDGDNLSIQFMGNTEITIENTDLVYTLSATEEFLGCENILFVVYDGISFAFDQIAVCSSIVPQDVQISMVGNTVELNWLEIIAVDSYKVHSSDDPYSDYTELLSGSFSQIDNRISWTDICNSEQQFYRVIGVQDDPLRCRKIGKEIVLDEKLKEEIRQSYLLKFGSKTKK